MINAIIIDDDQESIDCLRLLLSRSGRDVRVLGEANSAEKGVQLIRRHQPNIDVVFLDVQMPGADGFSVILQLETIDFKVIFVSGYDRFAIRAIRFSALDYLLKPVEPEELHGALDQLSQMNQTVPTLEFKKTIVRQDFFDKLAISTLNEVKFIPVMDIVYLESDNNYSVFHLASKQKITASKGIGHYEETLGPDHFFRIHNSYLVNLKRVQSYLKGRGGYLQLEGGIELEVSVRKKEQLMKVLGLG